MAGGKETPRQKMIGMMYLVLTALLALNVSKEILNAFVVMNVSLETTNSNIENKNAYAYGIFSQKNSENSAKVGPWFEKANKARNASKDLFNFIQNCKAQVIMHTDGLPREAVIGTGPDGFDTVLNSELLDGKDNYDVPSQQLGLAEPKNPLRMDHGYDAITLSEKINEYKALLQAMIPAAQQANSSLYKSIGSSFAMENGEEHGEEVSWLQEQFYHMPLAAVIANFSKVQTDIRNAEADVISFLYGQVDASSYKFNRLEAAVIAPTSYLLQGDSFRAQVFLAAFDTTQSPMITMAPDFADSVNGTFGADTLNAEQLSVSRGKGFITIPTPSEGVFTLKGLIRIKSPDGNSMQSYNVSTSYQVAKPSLTVSATKMNVFYKGVDNPISVSVPGVPADKIKVNIDQGTISKSGKDGYIVRVRKGNQAEVSVSAQMPDGSAKKMGSVLFRVKTVPDPKPYFAGKSSSDDRVKKRDLTAVQGVAARMENFDFDLKFKVTSFKLTMIIGGKPIEKVSRSNRITDDMKIMLKKAKTGSKVYIESIKAKGPDGTVRNLGSLSFKVI